MILYLYSIIRSAGTLATVLALMVSQGSAQTPIQIQSEHLLKVNLLYVGAHPDDESGVTATFAREVLDHGARAAVVLATRGEGGANAIGRQLGPSLGALREAELRRATAEYGINLVYFLDKTDFFYTMSSRAAFDVWDHDDALGRLVRLVRLMQPDVIVTMWPGPGTHGMHQAAGRLATEAFTAAADPESFPEQITQEFLDPWQPRKLYYNTGREGALEISSSDISPSRFRSYAEIKGIALRNYRSQAFDRRNTLVRAGVESFLLVKSVVPVSDESNGLLDGIEHSADPSFSLAPPPLDSPVTIRIVPRRDIREFRRWAHEHDVAWAAGLLPAARSIGIGLTDTLLVEIRNHRNAVVKGDLTLTLPDNWNTEPFDKPYTIPANGQVLIPYLVTVPDRVAVGNYPVEAFTFIQGARITDAGQIVTVPVMTLTESVRKPEIDGRVSDWQESIVHNIPSSNIWSGELPGGDADCSARARLSYDNDYLYVAIEVTDDKVVRNIPSDDVKAPWRSDAVEICIDPSGLGEESTLATFKTGIFPGTTAGTEARAVRDADARQGVIEETAPGMQVATQDTDNGYIVETAIAWKDVPGGKAPESGDTIGLNIIIYDGDDTEAGPGANIGKARLGWSYHRDAQVLPYHYGRAVIK
ncbi:MAG: sugar-binding protein [Gemmatimonadota bacterium]|nr:sugar-binding protein [Gemmatimonadota bacterium]